MIATTSILANLGADQIDSDFLIFCCLVLGVSAIVTWRLSAIARPVLTWVVAISSLALFLTLARYLAAQAGLSERERIETNLQNLAAGYSAETEYLNHSQIDCADAEDDPTYDNLLMAQVRWLKSNPQINDIYTFRRDAKGQNIIVVDSETDYNRDGKIVGETEQRTAPGEVWTEQDSALDQAFLGTTSFSPAPITDRWGTWYSLYTPLHDTTGRIEGVMGIDTNASTIIESVAKARLGALINCGVIFLSMLSIGGLVTILHVTRRRHEEQRTTKLISDERTKLENLISAVEGIVWESGADPASCAIVSAYAERMLGWQPEKWHQDEDFWVRRLAQADAHWVIKARRRAAETGEPWQIDYRMIHADGRTIEVRERGRVHQTTSGRVLRGVIKDVTSQNQHVMELGRTQKELIEASRIAGMAEVATGVLHNVGNVLNSINISSGLISESVGNSSLRLLKSAADLLTQQEKDLPAFVQTQRGQALPKFFNGLHQKLESEQQVLEREIQTLMSCVEHVKEIIMMQQSYARMGGKAEPLDLASLVEDALNITHTSLVRHGVAVQRHFQPVPLIIAEKNKVVTILVNLLRNAKRAVQDTGRVEREITITIAQNSEEMIECHVQDNGSGISDTNLQKLFSFGFTTRADGHGFGLHSSVNTAREMGGGLAASSPGEGKGATFILSLPAVATSSSSSADTGTTILALDTPIPAPAP